MGVRHFSQLRRVHRAGFLRARSPTGQKSFGIDFFGTLREPFWMKISLVKQLCAVVTIQTRIDRRHRAVAAPQSSWSVVGQAAYRAVTAAVLFQLVWVTRSGSPQMARLPATTQFTLSTPTPENPATPRRIVVGATIGGRGKAKTAVQCFRRRTFCRIFRRLSWRWRRVIRDGGIVLGHCAETRPWIKFGPWIRGGGHVSCMAFDARRMTKKYSSETLPYGIQLLLATREIDFWRIIIRNRLHKPFCPNCAALARELSQRYFAFVEDLAPSLGKSALGFLRWLRRRRK
ncbi:hypothetical protein DFH09DRAFT_1079465 [Mycena vulgaris]|nr:hypothetical protein DFH09DRAFT_1079465 [Mycena vulgaris]